MDFIKSLAGVALVPFYLLPGLLGTVVYDYLVEGEKRDNLERVLHAFVLTLVNALLVHEVVGTPLISNIDVSGEAQVSKIASALLDRNLLILALSASILSLVFAVVNNHDLLYRALRWLKVTYKVSSVGVWKDSFNKNPQVWLHITFPDRRSLIG
ncbi:MAG: DUF6338 family protein [Rhodospirillaceae bacterium]